MYIGIVSGETELRSRGIIVDSSRDELTVALAAEYFPDLSKQVQRDEDLNYVFVKVPMQATSRAKPTVAVVSLEPWPLDPQRLMKAFNKFEGGLKLESSDAELAVKEETSDGAVAPA